VSTSRGSTTFTHQLDESNARQEVWKLLCYHYTKLACAEEEGLCVPVPLATLFEWGVALPAELGIPGIKMLIARTRGRLFDREEAARKQDAPSARGHGLRPHGRHLPMRLQPQSRYFRIPSSLPFWYSRPMAEMMDYMRGVMSGKMYMFNYPTQELLRDVRVGSADWTWSDEFQHLTNDPAHAEKTAQLIADLAENGMRDPIVLGSDGRLWDGHHRVVAAIHLGWKYVPCVYSMSERAEGEDGLGLW
jgi:hypothetical protein